MTINDTLNEAANTAFNAAEVPLATSLLGPANRGMKLKVARGVNQSSEVIQFASRKCLVGSGENCDVRVVDPEVASIECLILHGTNNNVVRWLTASNDLEGAEPFQDELLRAGDPLQVGPVELELLVDEILTDDAAADLVEPSTVAASDTEASDRLSVYVTRLERLEKQLVVLQEASEVAPSSEQQDESGKQVAASIADLAAQIAVLQSRNATDRDLWIGEKAELESLLQSRLQQIDQLQDEVQRLGDELTSVRQEYAEAVNHAAQTEEIDQLARELAERTAGFEQEEARWDKQRSDFHQQLQDSLERLSQVETQLAEQDERQAAAEKARQEAEERAERLQESVDELSNQLAEQQEEFDRLKGEWDAERESLETELAETKGQLAESTTTESIELELREAWERERSALQSQVDEANSRLEAVQVELETQQELARDAAQNRSESSSVETLDEPSEFVAPTSGYTDDQVTNDVFESHAVHDESASAAGYDSDFTSSGDASYNPMDRLLAGDSFGDSQPEHKEPTSSFNPAATTAYDPTQTFAIEDASDAMANFGEFGASGIGTANHGAFEATGDAPAVHDQYTPTLNGSDDGYPAQETAASPDESSLSASELARERLAAFQNPNYSDPPTEDEQSEFEPPFQSNESQVYSPTDSYDQTETTEEGYSSDFSRPTYDATETPEEEIAFESDSDEPPVSTADVLARLGQSSALDDEEVESPRESASGFATSQPEGIASSPLDAFRQTSDEPALDEPPRYIRPSNDESTSTLSDKAASDSDDDEESIEAYMARLMKRVQATGDDDDNEPAPAPVQEAPVERSPITEYTEVTPEPTAAPTPAAEPEKINPDEYKPRSQAPEMAERMTAMRSLANDSARSAIASHAKRNWSSVMKMKLGVSIFAFVAVLGSLIFFWGKPMLMGLGCLVGLGVLGYWAKTAIAYRKLLLDSLMLEPDGGHVSNDEE